MIVTRKILEKKFKLFNEQYFNNELPKETILWNKLKGESYGQFNELTHESVENNVPIIYVNDKYLHTEETLDVVLLHEMVHESLVLKGLTLGDGEEHGELFSQKCNEIEEKSGYENIMRGVKFLDYVKTIYYIIVIEFHDKDELFVVLFDKEKLFKYYINYFNIEKNTMNIANFNTYTSKSNLFSKFPITNEKGEVSAQPVGKDEFNNEIIQYMKFYRN